jgi:hypothetical protein
LAWPCHYLCIHPELRRLIAIKHGKNVKCRRARDWLTCNSQEAAALGDASCKENDPCHPVCTTTCCCCCAIIQEKKQMAWCRASGHNPFSTFFPFPTGFVPKCFPAFLSTALSTAGCRCDTKIVFCFEAATARCTQSLNPERNNKTFLLGKKSTLQQTCRGLRQQRR